MISLGEPAGVELGRTRVRGRPGRYLMVILRAPGCLWARRSGGCTNCGFWHHLTTGGRRVPTADLLAQLERALTVAKERAMAGTHLPGTAGNDPPLRELRLFCSGSFFCDEEIQPEARPALLARCAEALWELQVLLLESRPEYLTKEALQAAAAALGRRREMLEVAVGLESADDEIRLKQIRKGFSLAAFERAADLLAEAGLGLVVYLLLKPLGLSDEQAVQDVLRSGRYLESLGRRLALPLRVALEPAFVPRGTPLHEALVAGRYTPPSLWSVVRVAGELARHLPVHVGLSAEGMPADSVPRGCPRCTDLLRQALQRFNESQDRGMLADLDCPCQHTR